jgi:hypothetical protein
MPSHYGSKTMAGNSKAMPKKKKANGKKNGTKDTHKMPDGTIMKGKTHKGTKMETKKKKNVSKANGNGGLTAAQKKLPKKLQEAIMKSKKKK